MPKLVWNNPGTRYFESGLDRGVLYVPYGPSVPWNGLLGVEQTFDEENEETLYFDGVKYGDISGTGDFSATLRAYTYPDEFLEFEGIQEVEDGLLIDNQIPKRFHLSYRSSVGSDLDSDLGYKIHILYNLTATSSQKNYQSRSSDLELVEFEWLITGVPSEVPGYQPSSHIILDSRYMNGFLLDTIEEILYGNENTDSKLPSLSWIVHFIENWAYFDVVDHLNGTFSVTGPDQYFTMHDETFFEIDGLDPIYLDADTYQISNIIKSKEY